MDAHTKVGTFFGVKKLIVRTQALRFLASASLVLTAAGGMSPHDWVLGVVAVVAVVGTAAQLARVWKLVEDVALWKRVLAAISLVLSCVADVSLAAHYAAALGPREPRLALGGVLWLSIGLLLQLSAERDRAAHLHDASTVGRIGTARSLVLGYGVAAAAAVGSRVASQPTLEMAAALLCVAAALGATIVVVRVCSSEPETRI